MNIKSYADGRHLNLLQAGLRYTTGCDWDYAFFCMCRRAYQRGYRVGRRGADHATAPYLKIPITKDLIRYWRDGHRLGLQRYEWDEGRSLLKMKAVGGVQ